MYPVVLVVCLSDGRYGPMLSMGIATLVALILGALVGLTVGPWLDRIAARRTAALFAGPVLGGILGGVSGFFAGVSERGFPLFEQPGMDLFPASEMIGCTIGGVVSGTVPVTVLLRLVDHSIPRRLALFAVTALLWQSTAGVVGTFLGYLTGILLSG